MHKDIAILHVLKSVHQSNHLRCEIRVMAISYGVIVVAMPILREEG